MSPRLCDDLPRLSPTSLMKKSAARMGPLGSALGGRTYEVVSVRIRMRVGAGRAYRADGDCRLADWTLAPEGTTIAVVATGSAPSGALLTATASRSRPRASAPGAPAP